MLILSLLANMAAFPVILFRKTRLQNNIRNNHALN
jgi:hypothetical protein